MENKSLGGEEDTWENFRNAVWDKALKLATLPISAQVRYGSETFALQGDEEKNKKSTQGSLSVMERKDIRQTKMH